MILVGIYVLAADRFEKVSSDTNRKSANLDWISGILKL